MFSDVPVGIGKGRESGLEGSLYRGRLGRRLFPSEATFYAGSIFRRLRSPCSKYMKRWRQLMFWSFKGQI